jgi:signal transduction histidine kinase
LLGAATIARDVSERKRAEEALQVARLREGQLQGVVLAAREVAHLLNNDLVIPIGIVELLRDHTDLPPHLRALLEEAIPGLDMAVEHIRQLQQVSRVETKDTPVGPSLDLSRSVQASKPD